MTLHTPFWRPTFDPNAVLIVFAWPRNFTHKGRTPRKGEILDKEGVAPNVLRALYESRWVRMAEPHELPPALDQLNPYQSVPPSDSGDVTQTTGEQPGDGGTDPKAAYAAKAAEKSRAKRK